MKVSNVSSLLLCSVSVSHAFPLLERVLQHRAPQQSYSVVAVDGGQSTTADVQTVTDQVTIVSTLVITESETPKTILITITQSASPITVPAPGETKTVVVEPSVTSSPYDDGMWKTTYYTRWTVSPSVPVSTASPSVPVSTASPSVPVSTASPSVPVSTASPSVLVSKVSPSVPTSPVSLSVPTSTVSPSITVSPTTTVVLSQTTSSLKLITTVSTPTVYTNLAAITSAPAVSVSTHPSGASSSPSQSIDWATAYGQWHDKPNASGSWWWK